MSTSHGIDQVDRYLRELSAALSGLPSSERDDVVAGVREHIDAALAGTDDPAAADVERVLRDLGDPLAIAAETTGRYPPRADAVPLLRREWVPAAVVLSLVLGTVFFWAVVSLVLWVLGVVLLWLSPLWRVGEKVLGTLAFPGAALAIAVPSLVTVGSGSDVDCVSAPVRSDEVIDCAGDGGTSWLPMALWPAVVVAILVGVSIVLWRRGAARVPR